uniref:Uncharacterized protein n=1 Tax=Anguilla anguilla TaxID=7936 RepID=A0A0E9RLJ4_ANGAN
MPGVCFHHTGPTNCPVSLWPGMAVWLLGLIIKHLKKTEALTL